MASRSSGHWLSETYQGSHRGRSQSEDFGLEMFPEKFESTPMLEDPEELYWERRNTLRDWTPDTPTLASDLPRRNTMARSHLNLRDGGVFGSTTDPYANEDYDISFHDSDPRGYSDQQPWGEYRRHLEAQMRRFDYRDDGDYSTTGGGVHPNTLYRNIRAAQNWTKSFRNIFDTSFENNHVGGVGVYPNISRVFKSSREEGMVGDEDGMAMTWEDPENRQRLTMHLSNILHGGSRMWRTESTTDHKVKVASYGKLYQQRGLIPHESQLRILEDDTPWNRIEGAKTMNRNLVKLMSTALEERGGVSPRTASESARLLYQDSALRGRGEEQYGGLRGEEGELQNRASLLTKDIMGLLGFVEQDVKWLESKASDPGKQGKRARRELANLYQMAEVIHSLPAHAKLDLRNELILRSNGGGLLPGDPSGVREQVVVNPKILEHMDLMVRKGAEPGVPGENRREAIGDPEEKLEKGGQPLFVFKNPLRSTEDVIENRRQGEVSRSRLGSGTGATEGQAASYKNLALKAQRVERNKRFALGAQYRGDASKNLVYKTRKLEDTDFHEALVSSVLDTEFGENKALTRHVGRIGSKNMRAYQDSDYASLDFVNELGEADMKRKNPKNRNSRTR